MILFHLVINIRSKLQILFDKMKVRCKQFKLQIFFAFFFTPSDRARAADHENLLFSLSKCFLPVESCEILEMCRFSRKAHPFSKCAKFSTFFFFYASENNFSRFTIKN